MKTLSIKCLASLVVVNGDALRGRTAELGGGHQRLHSGR